MQQSTLPPLSLSLSDIVSDLTPGLHNQNKKSPSLLQEQLQPPHQHDVHQPQKHQLPKKRSSIHSEQSEPTTSKETSPSSEPSGSKRGHKDDEGLESEGDDKQEKRTERRKLKIEYIKDKSRRHITFSKRKAGIMKKAHELSTLTGTQVLLLVVSETGLVYTYTTPKLQPLVTKTEGKNFIQSCLNVPDGNQPLPEVSSSNPCSPNLIHVNYPNTNVELSTETFYGDRKHPNSQSHLSTPPTSYAPLGHFGYNSQHYPTHPVTHFPMGTVPAYLGADYTYSQPPQFSHYGAPNNTPYLNPATYWNQPDPSSKVLQQYPPPTLDGLHLTNFQERSQFPSPPMDELNH